MEPLQDRNQSEQAKHSLDASGLPESRQNKDTYKNRLCCSYPIGEPKGQKPPLCIHCHQPVRKEGY